MPLHASTLLDLDSSAAAPPKRIDSAVCFECKRPFALTLRRHHCRRCGRSFCDRCSARTAALPKIGYLQPVRVCDGCWEEERDTEDGEQQQEQQQQQAHKGALGVEEEKAVERDRSELSPGFEGKGERKVGRFTLPALSKPNLFALKNSERELWLQADSAESRLEWVHALREVQARSEAVKAKDEPKWEIDFGHITLLNRVGGGTFGDVYRARLWGTEIAVKTLKAEDFESGDAVLDELKKEVSILSQLRHPNVVLYIGACTVPPHVCIATEWCGRGSLHDVLEDHSQHVNAKLMVELAMGIAQGVNYLHSLEHRIIHRDLKSANVLVNKSWQPRVSDFGLSHMTKTIARDGTALRSPATSPAASRGGAAGAGGKDDDDYGIVGTPEFLAPEVMEGLPYTEKVDVYSFGILLCELVTRQAPFHDRFTITCYMDVVEAVLDEGAIPTIPRWCEHFLQPLILRCLSREPAERPSFTEIIMKLREVEGLEESEYFYQFDLLRLREQLESTDAGMQALGASELAVIVKERTVRRVRRVEGYSRPGTRGFTESTGIAFEVQEPSATQPALARDAPPPPAFASTAPVAALAPIPQLPPAPGAFSSTFSGVGGPSATPDLWVLDDAFTAAFLERLTALLSSSFDNVQYASCLCLSAILSASSSPAAGSFHRQDRDLIVGEGAIRLLLSLLTSPNPLVVQQAGEVLLLLCGDMTGGEMLQFVGAQAEEMAVFVRVVARDVQRLEEERAQVERVLEGKRRLMGEVTALTAQQGERKEDVAGREERGVSHSHSKPRMQRHKTRAMRGGANGPDSAISSPALTSSPSLTSSPYSSSSGDERPPPPITLPLSSPPAAPTGSTDPCTPARLVPGRDPSSTSSPTLSPRRSHLKKFEYVLQHIDGSVRNITLTSSAARQRLGRSMSASTGTVAMTLGGAEEDEERNVELRAHLTSLSPTRPSPAFVEYFPSIERSSYALRFDCDEGWTLCFLALTSGELRVYASHSDAPDEALYVIRLSGTDAAHVRSDDSEGMQHCLTVEDLGAYTFAFDSALAMTQWKAAMDGGQSNGTDSASGASALTGPREAEVRACEAAFAGLPTTSATVFDAFRAEFPGLRHAGYLLKRSGEGWKASFFVLSDLTHLYSFDSHSSAPTDPDYQWELDAEHLSLASFHPADVAHSTAPTRPAAFALPTVGSPAPLLLCAPTATEREQWAHAVLPPSALPMSPTSSSSLALLHPFLSLFSHVDHHGWLSRKKKYSSRWVRQWAVLVDAELYLYDAHDSPPKEWASVVYICTQSGKPFEVVKVGGTAAGKAGGGFGGAAEWVWEMVNPSGHVSLKADGEKELEGWLRAIQENTRRLSSRAYTRQRKATH